MNYFSDDDIGFIYKDISEKGLTMNGLLDEMVDHICCTIEPEIKRGAAFMDAYKSLMDSLDSTTFKKIQHQTVLLTDLKLQRMKKGMFFIGLLGTVVLVTGVIFKINHWAGASIGLLTGILTLVFGFLPLFFYVSYKEQEVKRNMFMYILGYFSLAFLLLAPLFKILHWPGVNLLLFYGPLILAALFLPTYLVSIFRKANETKTNFIFIFVILGIVLSSLFMLSSSSLSKLQLNSYDSVYNSNMKIIGELTLKNADFYKTLDTITTSGKQEFAELKNASTNLNAKLNAAKTDLIAYASEGKTDISDMEVKRNKEAYKNVLVNTDRIMELKKATNDYKSAVMHLNNDPYKEELLLSIIDDMLMSEMVNPVLIDALAIITTLQKNCLIVEYELLSGYRKL